MSKAFRWFCRFCAAIVVFFVVATGLGVLLALLLVAGLQEELNNRSEPAREALNSLGLSAYAQYAPYDHLTIGQTLTAFTMYKYDNREDNTDLHAGIMTHAAMADGWHVDSISAAAYADFLHRTLPEAAFLFPENSLTFDAWYQAASGEMGFFDQDSGLTVWFAPSASPSPGSIREGKLSVPHNGFVYEIETHGGFHGDGITFRAFIVPEANRPALEAALSANADWHNSTIRYTDYLVLQNKKFYEITPLYPAEGTDFEWWSYVDTYARQHPDQEKRSNANDHFPAAMQEVGACWSMNWLVALYDADSGLFIFYQYDS